MKSSKVIARMKEPSTWAGISMLGMLFGVKEIAALGAPEIVAGLAALAAIFAPEGSSEKKAPDEQIQ